MSQMIFQQQQQGGPYIPPWLFMNQGRGRDQQSPAEMLALMQRSNTPQHYSPMEEMKAAVMGKVAIETLKHQLSEPQRKREDDMRDKIFEMQKSQIKTERENWEQLRTVEDEKRDLEKRQGLGTAAMNRTRLRGQIGQAGEKLDVQEKRYGYEDVGLALGLEFRDIDETIAAFNENTIQRVSWLPFSVGKYDENVGKLDKYAKALNDLLHGTSEQIAAAYPLAKEFLKSINPPGEGTPIIWNEGNVKKLREHLDEHETFKDANVFQSELRELERQLPRSEIAGLAKALNAMVEGGGVDDPGLLQELRSFIDKYGGPSVASDQTMEVLNR